MKKLVAAFVFLFTISAFSQKPIVLISNKYEFQKQPNSFNINNMLKAVLSSNSYQVYFDDSVLPIEIAQNKCEALTAVLVDKSNMFVTKVKLQFFDCQNKMLFETAEVKSKEKDIQTAYSEVLKLLSPEIKKYKVNAFIPKKPIVDSDKPIVVENKELIEKPLVSEFKTYLNCRIVEEFSNGINVVDADQLQILNLQKTKNPNIYLALKGEITGIFTVAEKKGIFEYYLNGKYMLEEYLF